ncbi:hypothetical protein AX15_004887 [Amanita polypyramis BW_CC]|nr:hypothetical protein AX15_004887 [Amanita polypyramis BW_CC]
MSISTAVSAISAVTLASSLLSMLGSGFMLICYLILPLRYHFRHILILNLGIADFLNALNGSVGGLYILLRKEPLKAGHACVLNGFVEQVTVQATDTAILVIAIVTVYTLTMDGPMSAALERRRGYGPIILICLAVWTLPFTTGLLALGMNWYAPASGNWCWIEEKPAYLRYALTHGWRFFFIIIEVCLYAYLHIWLRRHYQRLIKMQGAALPNTSPIEVTITTTTSRFATSEGESENTQIEVETPLPSPIEVYEDKTSGTKSTECKVYDQRTGTTPCLPSLVQNSPASPDSWTFSRLVGLRGTRSSRLSHDPQYRAIRKILLLNAYPLAYIILWIPGIINRSLEATGHMNTVVEILQASTQLVGLANALTYGWNEKVSKQLRKKFGMRP